MSDALDRISWFSKNIKSSDYFYGVPACYFKDMTYKDVLKEKIELAKALKLILIEIIESNTLKVEPKENEEYSEYQKVEMKLNDIEKAIEFNEFLLRELDNCKG